MRTEQRKKKRKLIKPKGRRKARVWMDADMYAIYYRED